MVKIRILTLHLLPIFVAKWLCILSICTTFERFVCLHRAHDRSTDMKDFAMRMIESM